MLTRRAVLGSSALLLLRPRLARADITSNLVGRWLMNENSGTTLDDTSGNALHVPFAAGGNAPTWTPGKYGSGTTYVQASSQRAVVSLATSSPLWPGTGNFTAAAWVKLASTPTEKGIFGWHASGGTDAYFYWRINPGGEILVRMQTATTNVQPTSTGTITDTTTFHHVAVVVTRGATAAFYLDGALSGSPSISALSGSVTPAATRNFVIGGIAATLQLFDGVLDECYLFHRALAASDITELMNASGVEARRRVVVY